MLRAASLPFPIPPAYTGQVQPYLLSRSAIPFISASSGSMGNNGALSGLTALPLTYANAYVFLPANAIQAGSAAGWYFVQMSSTTAGTVFNNTYTTDTPTIPSSPTPFVSTGPGAFTGVTTEQGVTIPVPADAIGANGLLDIRASYSYTNDANTKTMRVRYSGSGGTAFGTAAQTTTAGCGFLLEIQNRGAKNAQVCNTASFGFSPFGTITAVQTSSVDTSQATSIFFSGQKGNAADNIILESLRVAVLYGA